MSRLKRLRNRNTILATAAVMVSLCFEIGSGHAVAPPLATAGQPIRSAHFASDVCRAIRQQSEFHALPAHFLARLIWKESQFDPHAVSPKGAQGIAQFMPETAEENGLRDPFVPHDALKASAGLLAKLRADFGNLGLAAAAYNAGPDRVTSWLAGESELPLETEDYVAFITGKEAQAWSKRESRFAIPAIGKEKDFAVACAKLALRQRSLGLRGSALRGRKPLGIEIAAGASRKAAKPKDKAKGLPRIVRGSGPLVMQTGGLTMRVRKSVVFRVNGSSRAGARALCVKLRAAGRSCTVAKN